MDYGHYSVMLRECIDSLNIKPDGIYVDGTLGMGGHSYEIASRLTTGRLISIDRDTIALERAVLRLEPFMTARGDFYTIEDLPTVPDERQTVSRLRPPTHPAERPLRTAYQAGS